ncbi:MAG: LodA/GoxA family CTQ-dependent oxidase, partial [Acidobacteriia bacterium]|nr:LodA/GoxA family CTQ-dependent oxidase [Terriglobia bacterium]
MKTTYKIHPAIGIARLGNSTEFYLAPETTYLAPEPNGGLPIQSNPDGTVTEPEQPVTEFKDAQGAIKRQAARFRVYVYDDQTPGGRELQIGDAIQGLNQTSGQIFSGTLADIAWTTYLANKKASWYEFQQLEGEHGYAPNHPLRNAGITDPDSRQKLIIDPGPQTVSVTGVSGYPNTAQFALGQNPGMPQNFPPPLTPNSITTLGEIMANPQGKYGRLVVLGGNGNSGSVNNGMGQPYIHTFANNDGWFDDISDGPVTAQLTVNVTAIDGTKVKKGDVAMQQVTVAVDQSSWVIVGYPRY